MKESKLPVTPRRTCARRWMLVVAGGLVLSGLLLVEERLRGQWNLAAVKAALARRGQVTEFKQLLPTPPANFREVKDRFFSLSDTLGESWLGGGGNMVTVVPGKAARGSQAAWPLEYQLQTTITYTNGKAWIEVQATNTWAMMEQRYAARQTALTELRNLLREPPPVCSENYLKDLQEFKESNFAPFRRIAQCLNDVVMLDLHRGNLPAAEEDLIALSGLLRTNAKDPTLVGQMIRVAIEGLAACALWDAIQADSWTEPQLERIQRAWQVEPLLPGVATALHAEHLARLERYEVIRRSTYRQWQNRDNEILTGFGAKPTLPPYPVEVWCHYVFHPLWSFAWADQEKALYLERPDNQTIRFQEALQRRALANWERNPQEATAPSLFAAWRFYLVLPEDRMSETIGTVSGRDSGSNRESLVNHLVRSWSVTDFVLPNFSKAITAAVRNENMRQMAVTGMALKRYALRHGHLPDQLTALVPAWLPQVPVDWWDGKPLRYHLNPDGAFTLYCVGANGRDHGGDPTNDELWPAYVPWK